MTPSPYRGDVDHDNQRPHSFIIQRWVKELDIPMDEHPAMIDAVDWLHERSFRREITSNPDSRREWEEFLSSAPAPLNPWRDVEYDDGTHFDL